MLFSILLDVITYVIFVFIRVVDISNVIFIMSVLMNDWFAVWIIWSNNCIILRIFRWHDKTIRMSWINFSLCIISNVVSILLWVIPMNEITTFIWVFKNQRFTKGYSRVKIILSIFRSWYKVRRILRRNLSVISTVSNSIISNMILVLVWVVYISNIIRVSTVFPNQRLTVWSFRSIICLVLWVSWWWD